jgi:hypothetical protein
MQGIEPCLPVPKTGVLPVYDIPLIMDRRLARRVSLFKVSYFWFRINASNGFVRSALVVQWIEQISSKDLMQVRFLPGAQEKYRVFFQKNFDALRSAHRQRGAQRIILIPRRRSYVIYFFVPGPRVELGTPASSGQRSTDELVRHEFKT